MSDQHKPYLIKWVTGGVWIQPHSLKWHLPVFGSSFFFDMSRMAGEKKRYLSIQVSRCPGNCKAKKNYLTLRHGVWGSGFWVPGSGFWVLSKRDCRVALHHANGVTPRNDKRRELVLISPSVLCFKTLVTSHQTLLFGLWTLGFGLLFSPLPHTARCPCGSREPGRTSPPSWRGSRRA